MSVHILYSYDKRKFGKNKKRKTVQTSLNSDADEDQKCVVTDICNMIQDPDIQKCLPRLLVMANEREDRKISRSEALRIIMIATGKRDKRALVHILKRMRNYELYRGCETGFSLIIRTPNEIKNFLIIGKIEKLTEREW